MAALVYVSRMHGTADENRSYPVKTDMGPSAESPSPRLPGADADSFDGPAPRIDDSGSFSELPILDGNQFTSMQEILDALNIDRDYRAWERGRGFPADERFLTWRNADDIRLTVMADTGDVTATWTLLAGQNLVKPVEYLNQFRDLADRGSIFAMARAGSHFLMIADYWDHPGWDETTRAAIRQLGDSPAALEAEALAWHLVTQTYLGAPRGPLHPGSPGRTDLAYTTADVRTACPRAAELRDQFLATWQANGMKAPAIVPAPVVDSVEHDPEWLAACPPQTLPVPDFSKCSGFGTWHMNELITMAACPE